MKIELSARHRPPVDIDWTTEPKPAPVVLKVAHVADEATGNAHDRFRAPTVLGGTVEFDVPCERSESGKQVLIEGRKKGAGLANADLQAIEEAIAAPPERHIRHAARNGWYGPQRQAFVRQTGVVGRIGGLQCLRPPRLKDGEPVLITFRKAGTVQGWIDEVAMPARFSSRAILVIAATFAAPLLRILRFPSFGFNLFGANKSGKSTITTVAGSIIGLPNEAALPNLNTTTAGLLQLAGVFNDCALPLNEMALLGPKAYEQLGPAIYALGESRDRTRHKSSTFASDIEQSSFSTIFFFNSERSIDELARQIGRERPGGEKARCLDVPALQGGRRTVFDGRPSDVSEDEFHRWALAQMVKMREGCQANHGVVFDAYLERLIALGDEVEIRARRYAAEFVHALDLHDAESEIEHAAKCISVIYAGARIAMDVGILPRPWRAVSVRRAIIRCFREAQQTARLGDPVLLKAKERLHARLLELDLPLRDSVRPGVDLGYRWDDGGGEYVTIHATPFASWFEKRELTAILTWLDRTGALRKANPESTPGGGGHDWAVSSPRWAKGGKKVRSITFRLPN
ncbi:DUF927 domain-containing protein [Methylobacterium sp. J-092]|uniref:DUF927 domain-containing protein n=1 Tax=Methylobacterium sp. J-092 TaxID=2836667 RepID=UPI001FBB9242|nr:DUF927 domain-containing protein [Methylobacterium sp. J-092]MCJ2007954.1 DUF927 domain-containing protein [Methylobacterium sp. J-092]